MHMKTQKSEIKRDIKSLLQTRNSQTFPLQLSPCNFPLATL